MAAGRLGSYASPCRARRMCKARRRCGESAMQNDFMHIMIDDRADTACSDPP